MRVEKHYLEYIDNASNPTRAQFDDDWEPAGPMLRRIMAEDGLAEMRGERMYLTDIGSKAIAK